MNNKEVKIAEMTDKQFLRFRKWYERRERLEQTPHRGFYPYGFANYIKFNVKRKNMYEKKDTQPALPAHDGSSDGSGDLPFD